MAIADLTLPVSKEDLTQLAASRPIRIRVDLGEPYENEIRKRDSKFVHDAFQCLADVVPRSM